MISHFVIPLNACAPRRSQPRGARRHIAKSRRNADFLRVGRVPMNSIRPLWLSPAGLTRGSILFAGLSAPSPRLPSGRLRPPSTGYGEGRVRVGVRGPLHEGGLVDDDGAFPRCSDSWRGPLTRNLREERANSDLSPLAGRGRRPGLRRTVGQPIAACRP